MEAKQSAIKNAYGEHWENVKEYVDENGWMLYDNENDFKSIQNEFDIRKDLETQKLYVRYKILDGIDDDYPLTTNLTVEEIYANAIKKHQKGKSLEELLTEKHNGISPILKIAMHDFANQQTSSLLEQVKELERYDTTVSEDHRDNCYVEYYKSKTGLWVRYSDIDELISKHS